MPTSVAIVTGASQGIGHATAIRLARDFSAIALVARNRANLEGTAAAVTAAGAPIQYESLPDAAHAMHAADPERFAKVVGDWAKGLG